MLVRFHSFRLQKHERSMLTSAQNVVNTMEDAEQLLQKATCGDSAALGELLAQYRSQLTQIAKIRMDRRLQSRVDATDIIQEAFMEAINRFPEFVSQEKLPFFLWLRLITLQKLMQTHRFLQSIRRARHLETTRGPADESHSHRIRNWRR